MAFTGDLNSFSLADVFQTLANNQQTGVLRVYDEKTEKHIFFSEGSVRTVSTGNSRCAKIGQILIARGKIGQEQLDKALAAQKEEKNLLIGEILLEQGSCSNEDIEAALKFQVSEEVYDLFSWKDARFEFSEGSMGTAVFGKRSRISEIQLNTAGLLMEAARRLDEWGRISSVVRSIMMVPVKTGTIPEGFEFSDSVKTVYELCDGRQNVEMISINSCLGLYVVTQSLASLVQEGLVRDSDTGEIKKNAESLILTGNPDEAALLYKWSLERDGFDKEIARLLIEALEGAGSILEAADYCRVLAKAHADAGEFNLAVASYERAGKLTTLTGIDMDRLAELYIISKRENDAEIVWLNRARNLLDSKDVAAAVSVCKKALEFLPESENIVSINARIHLEAGDSHKAAECYEKLADIHEEKKDIKGAISACRSVLKLDASRSDIRNRIERLQSRNFQYRKRKNYRFAIGMILLIIALMAGGAVYTEINARKSIGRMEKRIEGILQMANSDQFDYQQKIDNVENFYKELQAFEPGFSFTDLSVRTERNLEIVSGVLDSLRKSLEKNRKDSVATDKSMFEKALSLINSLETRQHKKGVKLLKELVARKNDNEWHDRAVKELELVTKSVDEAKNVYESLKSKDFAGKFFAVKKLCRDYPYSEYVRKVKLPVKILASPDISAKVFLDNKPVGVIKNGGIIVELPLRQDFTISLVRKGFGNSKGVTEFQGGQDLLERLDKPYLTIGLKRVHKWIASTGQPVLSRPVITSLSENSEPVVMVATVHGGVFAYSLASGRQLWRFYDENMNFDFRSSPYAYKDKIYLLDYSGRLVALNRATGKLLWPLKEDKENGYQLSSVSGPPLFRELPFYKNDLFCVFGANDGKVVCLSSEGGKLRWQPFDTGDKLPVKSNIVYRDRNFIFCDGNGVIHVIQSDGTAVDSIKLPGISSSCIVENDGIVFVAVEGGGIVSLKLQPKLKKVWQQDRISASAKCVVLVNDRLICNLSDGGIVSLSKYSGKILSEISGSGKSATVDPVIQDRICVSSSVYSVVARNIDLSFRLSWKYDSKDKSLISGITAVENYIVFCDEKGSIYVLEKDKLPE